ncbi:hypothetical protein T459_22686 [Capsicum annuum]|uniref:Myb-like domain-containing protein n=1 Tax=Capsicum annuum TaxID=4072 RepID=A0A2G2YQK9_CAPAN|nr:hypothetical protein T459_22686 [Capsicum annuum]
MQVSSHSQKYFKHLEVVPKEKGRERILEIISTDVEAAGTSQVVLSTKIESKLSQESLNAEQTITVAEGESAGHEVAGGDSSGHNINVNDEYIFNSSFGTDDMFMGQDNVIEAVFFVDSATSIQKKMSTGQTCNSSFWTKEEDKINENTLAIYSEDKDLCTNMEETLPGKSRDDMINHYNILIEDVEPIDSGRVPLPNYPEVQSYSNQNSRGRVAKRGFLDRIETQVGFQYSF